MESPPAASWRGVYLANLVSLAIVLGFGVRPLAAAIEVRGRVAALLHVPPWPVYAGALLLAAVALALEAVARVRGLPPERRVFRLLPVVSVVFLAVHVFVVPNCFWPVPMDELVVGQFAETNPEVLAAKDGRFETEPAAVFAALETYPAPFVGRDGDPLRKWHVVVRTACAGPVTEVPAGLEAGSLIYCVSPERTQAWLTPISVAGSLAGPPAIPVVRGKPGVIALRLDPAARPALAPEPDEPDPGHAPQPGAPIP